MWRNTKVLIVFGFCLGLIIVPNFVSAWWNNSYSYRRNTTNTTNNDIIYPFINEDPDGDSSVSTYYGQKGAIYYNNDGDFAFANDTDQRCGFATKIDGSVTKVDECSSIGGGLVSYWTLDESSGVVWDPISDNNGTAQNFEGDEYGATGIVANAYDLNNHDDNIRITDDATLNTGNMTLIMWIYPTEWYSGDSSFLVHRLTGNQIYYMVRDNSPLEVMFRAYDTGGTAHTVHEPEIPPLNEWTMVTFMYNGTTQVIFYNSTEMTSVSWSGSLKTLGSDIAFGARYDGTLGYQGKIDNILYYNRGLSKEEISAIYNATKPVSGYDPSFGSEETEEADEITITDLKENPSDPATYSYSATYQFNATICDSKGAGDISAVKFEWSGSNTTITDYATINATCREYYTSKSDLSADTYNYKWYAEDTTNSLYASQSGSYTVNKATPTISGSVTSPITYGTASDYSGSESNSGDSDCSYILHRNGTQIDTGSSVSDATVLGASTYNYTYYTSGCTNYTSNSDTDILTVNKASANFSLSSSPSWSVTEGESVTITAEATPNGTITLYKDGNIVSNPYTASLGYGTYNFTTTYDHANYTADSITHFLTVTTGGFGCTDSDTYAFRKEITPSGTLLNLNFTDLVAENLVRSDLKDVYINNSVVPNIWTNFTGGYYMVVNVTDVASFNVTFGNYIANNSYTNHTQSANTTAMTGYSEINPYYVLTFIEETDGTQQLPPNTNSTVVSLFCSGGVSSFDVEDDKLLVSSFNQLADIKTTVTYSATEIYYRNYRVASSLEYKYVYLVDANQHQVVQLLLTLQDNTGDFSGSTLKIKKYLEGTLRTITEQQFDVENKVVVYLINGDKYLLTVDNGVEERSIGYLNVDPVDLEKTLVLYSIETTNMTVIENMSYDLSYNGVSIEFTWIDVGGQTDSVEFWVYNYTNKSQTLYYDISYNHSYVNFVYNVPIENDTYVTKWLVHHNIFGLNSTGRQDIVSYGDIYPASFPLSPLVQYLGGNDAVWFMFLIILPLPMLFTRKHAGIGAFFLVGMVALFKFWHFINIPVTYIGIGIFIAFLIEIINRRVYS
ncbi:MAG: LamG domain-containing protein [Candidatus Heimdallarchaeaceae archaeon]